MTSSKGNGNYDSMVERLLERFDAGADIGIMVQEILDALLKVVELITGLKADSKIESKTQLNTIIKAFDNFLKDRGIEGKGLSRHVDMYRTGMGNRVERGDIVKLSDTLKGLVYILGSDATQSKMAQMRGDKMNLNASSMSSPTVQQLLIALQKNQKANLMFGLNGLQRWWAGWASGYTAENDKKNKGLVNALIDGLAANKFVGGAAKDTVRLLGLLAGSWLKSHVKGPLGGMLAGGVYIISEVVTTVVPMVLSMLARGAIQGLVQGWVMGALGKGAATSAAQVGASAMLGTGAALGTTAVASTMAANGALSGIGSPQAPNTGAWGAPGPGSTPTGPIRGLGSASAPVGAYGQAPLPQAPTQPVATAINKNTSVLTKILQPLNKIWAPISKIGGTLLRVGGNVLGGVGSIFTGVSAYNSAKQGDAVGAWLKGISSVTGIAGAATGLTGVGAVATPFLWGASIVTGILGAIWDMVKGGDKKPYTSANFPTTGSFPSLSTGSSGGTGNGVHYTTQGGRDYVKSNLVNALDPRTGISKEAEAFIKNQEGLRLQAYKDSGGTPTIGHGHTAGVVLGMSINRAQAEKFFNDDVWEAKGKLRKGLRMHGITNANMPQEVYDMLVDAHFQAGYLPLGTKSSQPTALVNYIKQGNWDAVKSYLSTFKHSSTRRNTGRAQFIDEHKLKTIPKGQVTEVAVPTPTSTATEVTPPEAPKEEAKETKNEVAEAIKDASKVLKEAGESLKQTKEEGKPTGFATGLTDSIMKSVLGGMDVPGNDTTFKVLTKLNNISIFGGQ